MAPKSRPTVRDVAERAGVSSATVSFFLSGRKHLSSATEARVRAAIDELGFTLSHSARALRTGRHQAIGLLVPVLANPFFSDLAERITLHARRAGYAVVLATASSGNGDEAAVFSLLEERTDGVIWIPAGPTPLKPHTSVVVLDRPSALLADLDSVSADHYAGGWAAADLARKLGRKRIGLLSGPSESSSAASRRAGLLEHAAGLRIVWEVSVPDQSEWPRQAVASLADKDVDLVIAGSDKIAIEARRVLKSLGRDVPEEVSLIGFDDIPWADVLDPPLTTIRQPVEALAELAVTALMRRLKGESGHAVHRVVPIELIERGSTAPKEEEGSRALPHTRSKARQAKPKSRERR